MIFAEFYHKSATSDELIPACGDRSVLILDGRNAWATHNGFAVEWARQHGYLGFTLNKGDSFTRSHEIQKLRVLP